ncbi:MAG: 6-phosphofructo-2-kinase/fructose-2,6-bisphosphatase [Proteobacteria bacterium]|nr:6-phosphofructo-2-kinase/fructose-2,6-bisphosphatase [Pseudomonadota bacterium]
MRPDVPEQRKLVLVMVGLPARGKTYTARKLARYLNWRGHSTRVFNVGNYRRRDVGAQKPASFFDPRNVEGLEARRRVAMRALDELLSWLDEGGLVAIYDATNSTRSRRDLVRGRVEAAGHRVVFIESVCNDAAVVEDNIRSTKLRSPDYAGVEADKAVADFRERIAFYERAYEPVDDAELSWVKIVDLGRQVVVNRIQGYLPARLVYFLMNLHTGERRIWLTRHGQSMDNVAGKLGGDSSISPLGQQYAARLAEFMRERAGDEKVPVWTSTLQRTIQTAAGLHLPSVAWRALDEIDAGICEGLTYAEFDGRFPDDFASRKADKLRFRYPRGESYQDVVRRVEPVLIEIERQRRPLLVVAHQAVLRALYGYFLDKDPVAVPHLEVPLHMVIELTPHAYGATERRFELGPRVGSEPSWNAAASS